MTLTSYEALTQAAQHIWDKVARHGNANTVQECMNAIIALRGSLESAARQEKAGLHTSVKDYDLETPKPADAAPFGYAVQMEDGPFVGIWCNRKDAELICSKQPASHGDRVVPVFTHSASVAIQWQELAYAKLGVVRDKMPAEHVEIVQAFIGPLDRCADAGNAAPGSD